MKINRLALGLAFLVTLSFLAIAHALTTDQIWNNMFISASNSIRAVAAP